jgi:hypothetical protein
MKTFNNTAGTTSSEFSIGVGATGLRQIVLGAVCSGTNSSALDREGNEITIEGTEFFDIKILAVDQAGNRLTKQFRGTAAGSSVNKIEDTFEEAFDGGVKLSLSSNTLEILCLAGSSTTATYSIYASLQRVS